MDSNLNIYVDIKNEVTNLWTKSGLKDVAISRLKDIYKNVINSTRRMEYLNTPSDFIDILEKRGCLSHKNLQPLKEVSRHLENSSYLLSRINDSERNLSNSNNNSQQNSYAVVINPLMSLNNIMEIPRSQQIDFSKKQKQVYRALSMEIGQSWKNVARQLSINESNIDNIDSMHRNDLKSKISTLFAIFERKTDPSQWTETLCRALEKSRRKDLRYRVEDIMSGSVI